MEKIIEKIYNEHLKTREFPVGMVDSKTKEDEIDLYLKLSLGLPDEYKKTFLEYVDIRSERQREDLKGVYACGFKAAISLILESVRKE